MREIKFRAWDVDGNQFWDDSVEDWKIEYQNGKLTLFIWSVKWNVTNPDNSNEGYQSGLWEEVKNVVFQEFTRLYDKNGREIYEGDVYHQGDPKIAYTVVWADTCLKGKQNGSSSYAGLSHWADRIEVIGNIHEHPELLERSVEG